MTNILYGLILLSLFFAFFFLATYETYFYVIVEKLLHFCFYFSLLFAGHRSVCLTNRLKEEGEKVVGLNKEKKF